MDRELVSYRTLRRIIGLLGVGLPVVLAAWGWVLEQHLQPSISDYYAWRTRDALVGCLVAVAWFLFTYRGYDGKDSAAGSLACVCALGVAFVPNSSPSPQHYFHFIFAALLFLVLAYFSFFLFTRTSGNPTPRKLTRNRIYRFCGVAIVACIVAIGAFFVLVPDETRDQRRLVFWLESIALWAFGWSWFVKGETLFQDKPG